MVYLLKLFIMTRKEIRAEAWKRRFGELSIENAKYRLFMLSIEIGMSHDWIALFGSKSYYEAYALLDRAQRITKKP